jgi:hypothetical protein
MGHHARRLSRDGTVLNQDRAVAAKGAVPSAPETVLNQDRAVTPKVAVRSSLEQCPIKIAASPPRVPSRRHPKQAQSRSRRHLGVAPRRASLIEQCVSAGTTPTEGGRKRPHATSEAGAARAAGRRWLGWEARRRWAEARRCAVQSLASSEDAPRGSVARARHAARVRLASLTTFNARVRGRAAGVGGGSQGELPGRSLFGPGRSRPPRRRRGLARRARARAAGVGRALRESHQPRGGAQGPSVELPLSCARVADAHGNSAGIRLRPTELQEAPSCAAGGGPAQLGALVRWVAKQGSGRDRCEPRRSGSDVARRPRLASGGRLDRSGRKTRCRAARARGAGRRHLTLRPLHSRSRVVSACPTRRLGREPRTVSGEIG